MTTDRVQRLLCALPDGVSEIYFHPATGRGEMGRDATLRRLMPDYEHEAELAALLACREAQSA
jgi:hypothetical protein